MGREVYFSNCIQYTTWLNRTNKGALNNLLNLISIKTIYIPRSELTVPFEFSSTSWHSLLEYSTHVSRYSNKLTIWHFAETVFTKAKESWGNYWRTSICSFETKITFDWVVNWEGSLLKVKLGGWRKRNGLVALEMNTEKFSRSASVTWRCHYGLASAVYHVLNVFFLLLVRSDRYDLSSCKKPYKWPSLTALKEKVWYRFFVHTEGWAIW